ncbi:MAG TPA: hypothetical protein VGW75_07020 [Solirubrobacteraceae bacterium]|jgi:hypothetical protein|nr:hypothetical protein [Solirubrobacteraceae bacterium]
MGSLIGWSVVLLGVALCIDVIRHPSEEWAVCDDSRSIKLPWWLPFSNWVWDKNFWAVMSVPFGVLTLLPYLVVIRPRLHAARAAIAAAATARQI